jgi:hypothetical protein
VADRWVSEFSGQEMSALSEDAGSTLTRRVLKHVHSMLSLTERATPGSEGISLVPKAIPHRNSTNCVCFEA